jgi:GLE1-like protein
VKLVKSQKELKATWSALTRQITPKIGQLTNDPQEITRIVSFFPLNNTNFQPLLLVTTNTRHPRPPFRTPTSTTHLPRPALYTRQIHPPPGRNGSDGGKTEREVARTRRCEPPRRTLSITRGILRETRTVRGWAVPAIIPPVDVDGQPWASELRL